MADLVVHVGARVVGDGGDSGGEVAGLLGREMDAVGDDCFGLENAGAFEAVNQSRIERLAADLIVAGVFGDVDVDATVEVFAER